MRSVLSMKTNWAGFTLMDGIILIAACSVGTYFPTRLKQTDTRNSRSGADVEWAVACRRMLRRNRGALILVSQRFRGRRSAPGLGELFWLVPLVLFLTIASSQLLSGPGEFFLVTWFMLQCAFSCAALLRLVGTFLGMNRDVACRWTDFLGCTSRFGECEAPAEPRWRSSRFRECEAPAEPRCARLTAGRGVLESRKPV